MKKTLGWVALLASFPAAVWADGLQSLENFMRNAQAGQSQFTQTVSAPAKEGTTARTKTSSGTFAFQRPGKFKFVYAKPFPQTIVADGQTIWLYDEDLNQVTQRSQLQALGSTPAAILTSAHDMAGLQKEFHLQPAPDADGLEWVEAVPKVGEGQVKSVRVGFEGERLAAMDILDSFGQRSLIRFTDMQLLPSLPATEFRFVVPPGADVMPQ